jgi:hypothetical protein
MKTIHREKPDHPLPAARRVIFACLAFAVACFALGALIQYWPSH